MHEFHNLEFLKQFGRISKNVSLVTHLYHDNVFPSKPLSICHNFISSGNINQVYILDVCYSDSF